MRAWGGDGAAIVARVIGGTEGDDSHRAVTLAGGRIAERLDWRAIDRPGDRLNADTVLIVDARGIAEAILDTALPIIAAACPKMIVAFDRQAIDPVTASVSGAQVQWLCTPTMPDWIAALAIAAIDRPPYDSDHVAEEDDDALRHAELARIMGILARLGPSPGAATLADRRLGYDAGVDPAIAPADPKVVRRAIRARRLRDEIFGAALFEDPAWDMMLDLYATHLEGGHVSVSSLCIAAAVAPTTALRWIARLTEAGLFERRADPFDRRRVYMVLAPRALIGMRAYLAAAETAGIAIG